MIWFSWKVGAFDVRPRARSLTLVACAGVLVLGSALAAQEGEWPYFGGDRTFKRYSPLDRIDAVIQPSKTGFLYVFDRRTGEPVWPIEERAVPGSRVPGERLSPTQPFPTKPPPFDRQGFVEDDLIDFTPELRARALELVKPFRLGPIFTPPGLMDDEQGKIGTLTNPGWWGTGNWHTGAFDPETGIYYAVSHTWPSVYSLTKPEADDATLGYVVGYDGPDVPTLDGLPIVKPPYGRITAIDLHRGEHVWMAANGDGPRDHPLLEGLDEPPMGVAGRPGRW